MLKIVRRDVVGEKPVTVLSLDGRLVLGEEGNLFRSEMKESLLRGNNVILNMEKVTYLDPSGLGTMVACFHFARKENLELILCGMGPKVKDVLLITRLLTAFTAFDTCDEAINYLAGTKVA